MLEKIKVSTTIKTVKSKDIYEAWIDSKKHSDFTGGEAKIDPKIGGKFSAWNGYITGTTLQLDPYNKIVQKWRTSDFSDQSIDSNLEIILKDTCEGVEITLIHTDIPEGQSKDYEQGWKDFYFSPMIEYFS
ncbi:MAG: hypothetical protein A2086_09990 [Spirochaetes bacterium GWD1_27_9]|nr:MAG: hypothetical protein A2Z98_13910 [Spirochaetes bacterium GWB1_27_13]OHD22896.1 MAG: hypothetical protein A2Y34_16555 [Spirochaetes bacterium GWC1_27_15]OHD42260.1 MAG: hypothetical protein A2086_09990 [Spirochaetes bacterium GWD1_27_9]